MSSWIPKRMKLLKMPFLDIILTNSFTSLQATAKAHGLPLSTLSNRKTGLTTCHLAHQKEQQLSSKEEEFLAEWIIEQDNQEFPHTHIHAWEMAERILQIHRDTKSLKNKWVSQFKQHHSEVSSLHWETPGQSMELSQSWWRTSTNYMRSSGGSTRYWMNIFGIWMSMGWD